MTIEMFSRLTLFGRRHFFRIRAANGETLAQSESYSRRIDALATARSLKSGLAKAGIVDV